MENEKDTNHLTMETVTQNLFQLVLGGIDTTSHTFMNILNILVNHPEVQDKAYEELVRVVGTHRLPQHSDEADLPYINALITEAIRFRPIVTPGIPHTTVEEDTYMGYRIPAGIPVVINNHAIHFNPDVYEDPLVFKPERYLDGGEDLGEKSRRRPHYTFGAGRRVCPGQAFSETSLFLTVSRLLWSFKVHHPLDANGKENPIPLMSTDCILFCIAPRTKMRFIPRHGNVEILVGAPTQA